MKFGNNKRSNGIGPGKSRRRFMQLGAASGLAIGGAPSIVAAERPEASKVVRVQGTHDNPVRPEQVVAAIQTAKKDYLKRGGEPWSEPMNAHPVPADVEDNVIVDASAQIGPDGSIYGGVTRTHEGTPLSHARDIHEEKLDDLQQAMYEPNGGDD